METETYGPPTSCGLRPDQIDFSLYFTKERGECPCLQSFLKVTELVPNRVRFTVKEPVLSYFANLARETVTLNGYIIVCLPHIQVLCLGSRMQN